MQSEVDASGDLFTPTPSFVRLAARLSERRADLESWFDQRYAIQDIIRDSVGPDTFRALRRNGEIRPSRIYRAWCEERITSAEGRFLVELDTISTQAQYDAWLTAFSDDLRHYYDREMAAGQGTSRPMSYGARTKIPDLLMKRLMLWGDLPDSLRQRLIWFLHLPLDSRTMSVLAECARESEFAPGLDKLLRAPRMGLVGQEEYPALQTIARRVASIANIPTIYLDVLLWDRA